MKIRIFKWLFGFLSWVFLFETLQSSILLRYVQVDISEVELYTFLLEEELSEKETDIKYSAHNDIISSHIDFFLPNVRRSWLLGKSFSSVNTVLAVPPYILFCSLLI